MRLMDRDGADPVGLEEWGWPPEPAAENVLDELVDRFNARDLDGVGELVQRVEGVVGIDSTVAWRVDDTPSREAEQEAS